MLIISCLSQKGGVGKSTVARDIARQYAIADWNVKIADLDTSQMTTTEWGARRLEAGHKPDIAVEAVKDARKAITQSEAAGFDLLVFDGKPHSDKETKIVASMSDLIVIPTGPTLDDLRPQLKLAFELKQAGIAHERIVFLVNNVATMPDSLEASDALDAIKTNGFAVVSQVIPKRASYQNAQNQGQTLSEAHHHTLRVMAKHAVDEIAEIVEGLNG